jgi:rubrerythrin
MSKSDQHLKEAFAGESQANRTYLAFAERAEQEGLRQVARLFRAAAQAETVHALAHLRVLGAVHDTAANLKDAVAGETHEFQAMYPRMIADADAEGNRDAARFFRFANEVEQVHARLFRKALEELGNNPETDYRVCSVCGHTVEGEPPEVCPICGAKRPAFKKVD